MLRTCGSGAPAGARSVAGSVEDLREWGVLLERDQLQVE